MHHVTGYSPAKTEEYPRIFPNFQNCVCCEKEMKDNKHGSHHLGRKYARIVVLGHYLFLVTHSFPQATFSENCSLLRTDNVCGQISQHFSCQMEAIVYITQLMLKLGKNFVILNQWRQKFCHLKPVTSKWHQKCSPLQVIELLTEKTWCEGVSFLVSRK